MFYVPQSKAITVKIGPFVDSTDGVTAETALTVSGTDVRLSKNGGNFAARNDTSNCPHDEIGYYDCSLNGTDTNTIGRLLLAVNESGAAPVWHEFMVVHSDAYGLMMSGTDIANFSNLDTTVSSRASSSEINNVVSSGDANWATADVSSLALQATLETVSGDIAALNDVSIDEIVASGNAANWSGVADVSDLALQATLVTVSGDIANIDTELDRVTVSGLTPGALSQIVASGNAANWDASASGITMDANLVSIDGQATNGNNATLNLKQLNVVNSSGDAGLFQSASGGAGLALISQYNVNNGLTGAGLVIRSDYTSAVIMNAVYNGVANNPPVVYGYNWSTNPADGIYVKAATTGYDVHSKELIALQATSDTISGNLDTKPDIDTIVASGNAEGWNTAAVTTVTVSGHTPGALSEIIASGDAAGWGATATIPVTVSGFTPGGVNGLFDATMSGSYTMRQMTTETWSFAAQDVDLSNVGSGILHAYKDPDGNALYNLTAMPSGRFRS